MQCKQCGKYMNPVQAILSSTHGVCGECCRKNQELAFIDHYKKKQRNNSQWGELK